MSDGPNIVGLPSKPDEIMAAVEYLKRSEAAFVEMAALMARIRRAHFLAYKDAGFSDAEALVLCQKATL